MLKKIKKYIIIIITFYIIYLGVLPVVLNYGIKSLCKRVTSNSNYTLSIENPRFRFSVLPTMRFETANERYHRLLREHPEVIRLAPLSEIASYLLMTPETLSRVRAGVL